MLEMVVDNLSHRIVHACCRTNRRTLLLRPHAGHEQTFPKCSPFPCSIAFAQPYPYQTFRRTSCGNTQQLHNALQQTFPRLLFRAQLEYPLPPPPTPFGCGACVGAAPPPCNNNNRWCCKCCLDPRSIIKRNHVFAATPVANMHKTIARALANPSRQTLLPNQFANGTKLAKRFVSTPQSRVISIAGESDARTAPPYHELGRRSKFPVVIAKRPRQTHALINACYIYTRLGRNG